MARFWRKISGNSDVNNSDVSHIESEPELHIMIVGLPRSGKSTGLNNIFDLELLAKRSATPVTQKVVSVSTKKNDISLTVHDIPGLSTTSIIDDKIVLRDVKELGSKHTFLLILTLSVARSSSITEGYKKILENLTTIFGPKIWDWCLVLLTFSDTVCNSESSSNEERQAYLDYLKEYCTELQKVLASLGVKKPVKLFHEYVSFQQFRSDNLNEIVAIPVGKFPDISTKRLFPLQPWTHNYQWTDLALMAISKLNKNIPQADKLRSAVIQVRYGYFSIKDKAKAISMAAVGGAVGGGVVGAGAGAGAGGIMGLSGGFVGAGVGALLGGGAGLVVGGIAGAIGIASGAIAVTMISNKLEMQRREKTR